MKLHEASSLRLSARQVAYFSDFLLSVTVVSCGALLLSLHFRKRHLSTLCFSFHYDTWWLSCYIVGYLNYLKLSYESASNCCCVTTVFWLRHTTSDTQPMLRSGTRTRFPQRPRTYRVALCSRRSREGCSRSRITLRVHGFLALTVRFLPLLQCIGQSNNVLTSLKQPQTTTHERRLVPLAVETASSTIRHKHNDSGLLHAPVGLRQ